jgi:hypothetical protein
MKAGIVLVRAYLLRTGGDQEAAAQMLAPLWADRPLSRQFGLGVIAALGDGSPTLAGEPVLQALARLDPRLIAAMYADAFDRRDFGRVIALSNQLASPAVTVDIGTSSAEAKVQVAENDRRILLIAAEQHGALAYSLASLGRDDAAKSTLAEAEANVARLTPKLFDPVAPGGKEGGKARLARSINTALSEAGAAAKARLTAWRDFVSLRQAIDREPVSSWKGRMALIQTPPKGVALDLLAAARARTSAGEGVTPETPAELPTGNASATDDFVPLFTALPHVEIAARIPAFKATSTFNQVVWGNDDGFKIKSDSASGTATIDFTGMKSSASVVEELALLRAAMLVRDAGKNGFVIVGRRDYQRSVTTTYNGVPLRTDPSGYTTQLDIEFVDQNAIPDRYRDAPWRVLSTDKVLKLLEPTYLPAAEVARS